MILLIDNYDSFTFNLYQILAQEKERIDVVRNDAITIKRVYRMKPSAIILSPGPGRPESAGICLDLVREFGESIPILGVCLGHQTIAMAFGAEIIRASRPVHGKTSQLTHTDSRLFQGIPNPFTATRYHSLIVKRESLPKNLIVTAQTDSGIIMGIRHRDHPIEGVQFHPESIMTPQGRQLLSNFRRKTQ